MSIDLTSEQRQELWLQLTPIQQQTLQDFKKYRIQSLFLTKNFLDNQEWQFLDFKENPAYPHGEENRLYCRCGRELKYQFLLISQNTGEILPLGVTHFAQHLSVEPQIAEQIQTGLYRLDRGMDLILQSKAQGLQFPHRYYNLFINHGLSEKVSSSYSARLKAFKKADLPLYEEDIQELVNCLKKADIYLSKTLLQKDSQRVKEKNHFKELIICLQQVELGEELDLSQLREQLPITEKELLRWLGYLTGTQFPLQLKQVGDSFYRIA